MFSRGIEVKKGFRTSLGQKWWKNQGLFSIDMTEEEDEDAAYQSNLQNAELNTLSGCMAVMRRKKYCGFYQDVRQYCFDVYSINDGVSSHEKIEES